MAARRGAPHGAGRPAAGGLTLGQASGGRPAPIRQGLGLGLGLNPRQRGAFTQAAQGGSGVNWMTSHPNVMRRLGNLNPTGQRATNVQNFIGTGQSQRGNLPRPPTRGQAPGARGMMRQPQMRPMGGLLPQNHPLQPYMGQVNPGMQSVLASRGNQMPTPAGGWTGGDSGFGGGGMPGQTGDSAAQQPGLAAQSAGAPQFTPQNSYGGMAYGQPGNFAAPDTAAQRAQSMQRFGQDAGYMSRASQGGIWGPINQNMGGGSQQQQPWANGNQWASYRSPSAGGQSPYAGSLGNYGSGGGSLGTPYGGGMGGYFGGGGMYGGGQLPQGSYRSGGTYGQSGAGGYGMAPPAPGGGPMGSYRSLYGQAGGGAGGYGMAPPMPGGAGGFL